MPDSDPDTADDGEDGTVSDVDGTASVGDGTTSAEDGTTSAENTSEPARASTSESVRITEGLLTALLDRAQEAEPDTANVVLDATPAGAFDADLGLPADVPVFTHLFLPSAGGSVRAVFGVDLGRPSGRGRARFVSHPQGPPTLTREDDLAPVVLVAVPPWAPDNVAAFTRGGRDLDLVVVDAEPPVERL